MANFVFDKAREKFLNPGTLGTTSGTAIDWIDDTVKASLMRNTAHNPAATDVTEFVSGFATRVMDSAALGTKTATNGTADCADVTFTAVPSGAAIDWVLIWKDTGTATSSPVIARLDLTTSVTPNGGDITVNFNASGLFKL